MLAVQRDLAFYQSLVELLTQQDSEPLLRRALRILVELTNAREAYLEVRDGEAKHCVWCAEGCDDVRVEAIRELISSGIIAESLSTGQTTVTASARFDPRFEDLESVRANAIESVLCVPISAPSPSGVVYLQGKRDVAVIEPFSDHEIECVELFARVIAPSVELLVRRLRDSSQVETVFGGVATRSESMRELLNRLAVVSKLDLGVLLTGPSGVGKTLLAHAIHAASPRKSGAFIALNCAAIPETLFENELFGADPGAHSTAQRSGTPGKIEAAEGGTLFLDEVGELALGSQAKLLQLLNDGTYYRLGSARLRRADVRVLAATNISLPTAVRERQFREDLYYRLKVFEARVPSLAERSEDIALLANHFCRAAGPRLGLPVTALSPAAIRALESLEWPGNVRELANRVEQAMLNAHFRGVQRIEAVDVLPDSKPDESEDDALTLQEATRQFQKRFVIQALRDNDWNVARTSRQLDIARSNLYNLIESFGLRRER